jgi:2-phosphosulfolactate phosphatase
MTSALASGARAIHPAVTVEEARSLHARLGAGTLLCGERGGVPPEGFDLGNSPETFTPERVAGRTIVHTTTNGTRAILKGIHAEHLWIGAMVNLATLTQAILSRSPSEDQVLWIFCAGTGPNFAMEDALFAGALCERLNSSHPARSLWRGRDRPLPLALSRTTNGRNLQRIGLAHDIAWCAQTDKVPVVGKLRHDPETNSWLLEKETSF